MSKIIFVITVLFITFYVTIAADIIKQISTIGEAQNEYEIRTNQTKLHKQQTSVKSRTRKPAN
jgi:predicted PurR-regulated permease PerM